MIYSEQREKVIRDREKVNRY